MPKLRSPSTSTGTGVGIFVGLGVYFSAFYTLVWLLSSTQSGSSFNARTDSWAESTQAAIGLGLLFALTIGGYVVGVIAKRYVDTSVARNEGNAGTFSMIAAGMGWVAITSAVALGLMALLLMYLALIAFCIIFGLVGLIAVISD